MTGSVRALLSHVLQLTSPVVLQLSDKPLPRV